MSHVIEPERKFPSSILVGFFSRTSRNGVPSGGPEVRIVLIEQHRERGD
jgi:hypothetical protein